MVSCGETARCTKREKTQRWGQVVAVNIYELHPENIAPVSQSGPAKDDPCEPLQNQAPAIRAVRYGDSADTAGQLGAVRVK